MSLSDRITYAVIGAVFGLVIGAVLFWLLGVYSNILGPTGWISSPGKLIVGVALCFAAVGFIFGSSVGTIAGNTISAIYEFERTDLSAWVVVLLLAVVAGLVWYTTRS